VARSEKKTSDARTVLTIIDSFLLKLFYGFLHFGPMRFGVAGVGYMNNYAIQAD
jgi:hypothetical protein